MQLHPTITEFLDRLDPDAEGRVLAGKLVPGMTWSPMHEAGCLTGLAFGFNESHSTASKRCEAFVGKYGSGSIMHVPGTFDRSCIEDGVQVVAEAIHHYLKAKWTRRQVLADWDEALETERVRSEVLGHFGPTDQEYATGIDEKDYEEAACV